MNGGDVVLPLDIHVAGIATDNTVPVIVTIVDAFPTNYASYNIKLYHVEGGATVAMTSVDAISDVDAHNEYYYNPETGDVTIALKSFSEVTATVANGNPWDGERSYNWFLSPVNGEYIIKDAADFAGFAALVGGMAKDEDGKYIYTATDENGEEYHFYDFKGKTVKLNDDINLGGKIFTPVGYYFTNDKSGNGTPNEDKADIYSTVRSFEGTFDGQGHTILNILQRTWDIKGDDPHYNVPTEQYYNDGMGIFGFVYNGTIKNLAVVGFESDGEFCTTGCVAAYAAGVSNFENIRITKCNPRAYNVPNGGVVGYAYDEAEAEENVITFKDVTVDPTTKITALWGSWDVGCGGILGRCGDSTKIKMENCTVGAIIDVYNDVCANYQYYQYRYCGMLIGTVGSDGDTSDQEENLTFEGVKVYYGDWSQDNNYYCELVENSIASYTHDYQFSRLTKIDSVSDIKGIDSNWNKTGNYVVVDADGNATCYHIRKDVNGNFYEHKHADNGTEIIDGEEILVEDHQCVHIPFKQFYAGYGWGADHAYDIAVVAEAKYTITFMSSDAEHVLDVQYITTDAEINVADYAGIARQFTPADTNETKFNGWVTSDSVKITKIAAGNKINYVLYVSWTNPYTARFVDQFGNVVYTRTFTDDNRTIVDVPPVPEVENCIGVWESYTEKLRDAEGDITIRPIYTYEGKLKLTPVDNPKDGVIDYYKVEAVGELDEITYIPGYFNGLPVKDIEKLYKNENNFDYGSGVQKIVIGEGVETIQHNALAYTKDLDVVELPSTITYLSNNVFSRNFGNDRKQLTITFNGTMAEWKAIQKHENWHNGLKDGSVVKCTDGYFELEAIYAVVYERYEWNEHPY